LPLLEQLHLQNEQLSQKRQIEPQQVFWPQQQHEIINYL